MAAPSIDTTTFRELQATVGADFVDELIDTFLEEAPAMLDALREALAGGRAEAFGRAAHSLKANANTFGALSLGAMARELELGGLGAGRKVHALDALADEYARVRAELQGLRGA